MQMYFFTFLFLVSRGVNAGILSARLAPTFSVKWPAHPVPAICTGSSRMHLMPAICANLGGNKEARRQWAYFFVPKDIQTPDRRKEYLRRWEDTAKNFKEASWSASFTGLASPIAKYNARELIVPANQTAQITKVFANRLGVSSKSEKKESYSQSKKKEKKVESAAVGFTPPKPQKGMSGERLKLMDESEKQASVAAAETAWAAALESTVAAASSGWTPGGARAVAAAAEEISKLAAAARDTRGKADDSEEFGLVSLQWSRTAKSWEEVAQKLEMSACSTSDLINITAVGMFFSLLAGFGTICGVRNFCSKASNVHDMPLLASDY